MLQTTCSIPLDVKPESAQQLEALLEDFKKREDKGPGVGSENFARLINGIPTLHFMSMSIFRDAAYDPIFIIEVNCDGAAGPFWAHLEVLAGEDLREMLRCCKRPLDHNSELYDTVTARGSVASVIPYLEAMTQGPSVFHHGNRGLRRDRILREAELFRAVRAELDSAGEGGYFGKDAPQIHQQLRAKMHPDFGWLDDDPEPRITKWERFSDITRLGVFATLVMFALALPGIIGALILPHPFYLVLLAVLAAWILYRVIALKAPLPDTDVKTDFSLIRFLVRNLPIIALIFLAAVIGLALPALGLTWMLSLVLDIGPIAQWGWPVMATIAWGVLSVVVVTVPGLILWLRWLERRDSSQYMADIDPVEVAAMARREDWVSQNHMGSIVHIRPGVFRTLVVKAGHRGLGLLLRVTATDGYLGSMRTVHFAHWAFLNNSSRLLFFSNFDQSWGAYLDDFIEKAHVGLTLAWGCGVGFPPTRFLIYDGASHGRLFKNWALASRTVSRFWCSAYPALSVDQIERNYRVAEGLRQKSLSADSATDWVRDL